MTYRGKRKSYHSLNTRNVRNSTLNQHEKKRTSGTFKAEWQASQFFLFRYWDMIPLFHQRSILVLLVLWITVIIWTPKEEMSSSVESDMKPLIVPMRRIQQERPISDLDLGAIESVEHYQRDKFRHRDEFQQYDDDYAQLAAISRHETQVMYEKPHRYTRVDAEQEDERYARVEHYRRPQGYDDTDAYDRPVRQLQSQVIKSKRDEYTAQGEAFNPTNTPSSRRENQSRNAAYDDREETAHPIEVSRHQDGDYQWINHQVRKGENLTKIFKEHGLNLSDLYAMTAVEGRERPLTYLKPNQTIRLRYALNGRVDMFELEMGSEMPVSIIRNGRGKFERVN